MSIIAQIWPGSFNNIWSLLFLLPFQVRVKTSFLDTIEILFPQSPFTIHGIRWCVLSIHFLCDKLPIIPRYAFKGYTAGISIFVVLAKPRSSLTDCCYIKYATYCHGADCSSTWYSSDLSSSVPVDSFCAAIRRCIYLRPCGHGDLRRLSQRCSFSKPSSVLRAQHFNHCFDTNVTCISSQYMEFIDSPHVWIASGFVDFRCYHIRCLLPGDATTFAVVAALCISFNSAVDPDLSFLCVIAYDDVTSTPYVGGCSITVAPMSNYSSVALVHHSPNLPSNEVE
jgi:hypothetical protein